MKSEYEENSIRISPSVDSMRNYIVVKSDDFVLNVPYPKMTLIQNRIIAFLISLIKQGDDKFKDVVFDTKVFSQIFNMHSNSTATIKKSILGLRGNPVFTIIAPEVKGSMAITWCHVYIEEKTGIIKLRLDEDLERYFLNIDKRKGFIKYSVEEIMHLKCKYSFWFFDQFKLGLNIGKRNLSVDYIRTQLGISDTMETKRIKEKIINPAIEDINKNSFYSVTYQTIKRGREITGFKFFISYKEEKFESEEIPNELKDLFKNSFPVDENDIRYIEIIEYLNFKAKKSFDVEDNYNKKLINYWLNEGYTKEDFFNVIDIKTKDWLNTKYEKYLNPITLFGDKFIKYNT